jgi:NAD(P) transhydrogenase
VTISSAQRSGSAEPEAGSHARRTRGQTAASTAPQLVRSATMSSTQNYDLIVIGSGPAGEKGAAQAAYFSKKVALVERARIGGVCVHTGTIPSKSLRESALYLSGLRTRAIEGFLSPHLGRVRIDELTAHKERVCSEEGKRVHTNMVRHGVELFEGDAHLTGPNTVVVVGADGSEQELRGAFILVATGSVTFRPPSVPFDRTTVFDSDDILALDTLPESLLVIGAGVIGCEYASIFAALGVRVILVEPRDQLLSFIDAEIARHLAEGFAELGLDLRLGTTVDRIVVDGPSRVRATLSSGEQVRTEKVLFAAGRSGATAGLGLETAGIAVNRRGQIPVDHAFRTHCPNIYAAGDVIGFPALASTSMDQGRVAVCHAFGLKYKTGLAHLQPYGIYTIPELSSVGVTEGEMVNKGEDYEVGRAWFNENARGRINGSGSGMIKLIFDPLDKRLLGVHIVGEHAAELVHIGMMTMHHDGTIDAFIDAVYNYPTLSEAYKYAAYDGLGRLQRRATAMKIPKMNFDDMDEPPPDGPAPLQPV